MTQDDRARGGRVNVWSTPRRRFLISVLVPVAISIFSQFEFVQQSTCGADLPPRGLWKCETLADVIAPAWALAIIPIARRLRSAAARYGTPATDTDSWVAGKIATARGADRAARAASWGALLIIVLAYTREWERFGQQPEAVWFVSVIVATLLMLAIPLWWIRGELHRRGVEYLSTGRFPRWANAFLMGDEDGLPPRAPHVLAFSLVTLVIAFMVLGQLDALLRGMHLPQDPSVGIGGLASVNEFDLSQKPGLVVDRVATWREYTNAVGARFGSAYAVVSAHAIFDTITTIPAYLAIGVTFAAYAWRQRQAYSEDSSVRRAFELITLTGLLVLFATVALDLAKNLFSWYVMDRAWNDPAQLTNANVRLLWFFALGRTIGLAILLGASVLLLALWDTPTRHLRGAFVAVRSEILLVAVFALVVLTLPQTADVIRGWQVSHTVITVAMAVVLSMLVRWTSVTNLRLQHLHWRQGRSGVVPEPPRVRLPWGDSGSTVGRFAAGLIVVLAAAQLVLSGLNVRVGRGLVVPAVIVTALWLFGLALPPSPFVRGDRPVGLQMRRRLPRILGSLVYLIIGIAVIKAAASSVAYARHEDWWLFFALVPPAIGVYRIVTRTTHTMGWLEAGFAGVVTVLAIVLLAEGDPELSPTALAFAGVTFAYGSLAFFSSYERTSLANRISQRYLSPVWAKPFVASAAIALAVTVIWFYTDPIGLAPRIGTIGMIVMAMMVLTLLGAGAVRFAELTRPPRILAAFNIKRTPVVAFLVLWLLLAPTVVDQTVNDVRVRASPVAASVTFEDVWERWTASNISNVGAGPEGRRAVPLLLVSSSGGGLRAAAWTSFVLDCVFEGSPDSDQPCGPRREATADLRRVAVMSGVSGGSLGIAEFVAHVADNVQGRAGGNSWVDAVLGDDYLAAPIGWLFFVDLPRSLVGFGTGIGNRSEIMERAWEASWPQDVAGLRQGIVELASSLPAFPAIVFNATSVNDGCRVNVSVVNAGGASPEVPSCAGSIEGLAGGDGHFGATHDLVDFLCPGDDVALSTAAGMSARFPVVSVAGRVAVDPDRDCANLETGAVFVADGGYIEGSGAGTLLDSWQVLAPWVDQFNNSHEAVCVVPFMMHIDNGYESFTVSANEAVPREFAVPLLAVANSSSGITAARAEAALAFEHPFTVGGSPVDLSIVTTGEAVPVTGRYVRLTTRAHPGVQAPLGWTLSQASLNDLRDQLNIDENRQAISEVRSWLEDEMVCDDSA